jgi:hypothetical protein
MSDRSKYSENLMFRELFEKNFNTNNLVLSPVDATQQNLSIYDVYEKMSSVVGPMSMQQHPLYWQYCIQSEIMEFLACFNIHHWKTNQNRTINGRHIFEAADVILLMHMYNIVNNTPSSITWNRYEELAGLHHLNIGVISSLVRLSTDIDDPDNQSMILACLCHIGNIPYNTLVRACAIKTVLVGLRIKDNFYVDGWTSEGSDGCHIDDRCYRYLQDTDLTPFEIYLLLLKDIRYHLGE